MNTLPISAVTRQDVHEAIHAVLDSEDTRPLHALLARIDWSHGEHAPLRDEIALVEGWTADYTEGLMTRADYLGRLLQALAKEERAAS